METIVELKYQYNFNYEDEKNLKELKNFGEKYREEFVEKLHTYIHNFKDVDKYFPREEIKKRHKEKLMKWFTLLFSGSYGSQYLKNIYRTGEVHLKIGLPPHYLHATMNFVREFIHSKLTSEFGCTKDRDRYFQSIQKLLDLNLDVMSGSYREEELKLYLASGKLHRIAIEAIRRIIYGFDFFIVIALLTAGLFLIYFILEEGLMVVRGILPLEKGALGIMGSSLILYAISELLSGEITKLRGGTMSLKIFVSVALAAIIRKVLITSLSPEKTNELLVLSVLLISLGIVYWIIRKVEGKY